MITVYSNLEIDYLAYWNFNKKILIKIKKKRHWVHSHTGAQFISSIFFLHWQNDPPGPSNGPRPRRKPIKPCGLRDFIWRIRSTTCESKKAQRRLSPAGTFQSLLEMKGHVSKNHRESNHILYWQKSKVCHLLENINFKGRFKLSESNRFFLINYEPDHVFICHNLRNVILVN